MMCAIKLNFKKFLRVIKRTKWLFISILIIYAFTTPGEYLQQFPANFTPTYEGCKLGLLQVAKLLIALAALNLLFATSSVESLMAGLYSLLSPLKLIGLNIERFTARLMLTLDYVEALMADNNQKFNLDQLDKIDAISEADNIEKEIILVLPFFTRIDKFLLVITIGALLSLTTYRLVL